MLALSTLNLTLTALCYLIAVGLFVVAAFVTKSRWTLVAAGLAFAYFPVAWNAVAAA